jgi:hypothetical protein
VAFHELNVGFKQLGVDEGDLIVMERFLDPRGLALTGNSTTIYAMSYLDLDQNGPMVVEVSAGSYGAIFDLWQQPIAEIGPLGVDKGAGGKFLIMPRNRADPPPAGYLPVHSRTSLAALFARGIVDDVDGAAKSLEGIRVYPLTQAHDPPATKVVLATGRDFNSIEPQGLEYWRRVSLVMERVEDDQDGGFLRSILSPLGIAPGEPFQPDARQQAILADAAEIGWAICQAISMAPRLPRDRLLPRHTLGVCRLAGHRADQGVLARSGATYQLLLPRHDGRPGDEAPSYWRGITVPAIGPATATATG